MIQMMMATIGGPSTARGMQAHRHAWMLRKTVGCAIVASGFAVIAVQALQHVFGG
ncbi:MULTISPECIES: hypothetical protein [Burkholderiaceae]|uniref:hypothetical protein n=1 Tax=Burkholderiaceae TaxID=119060 RepID=UPI001421C9DC|nr:MULTISPECIES: hypothetical protein [Burkholderiaceae]